MSRQENDDISSENPSGETRRNEAREGETRRRTGESEKQRSSRPTFFRREREKRKRADGEDIWDWDSIYAPSPSSFDSQETYMEAFRQWCRFAEHVTGADPRDWPEKMNVSDTIELFEETLGVSRTVFYRRYRSMVSFNDQFLTGKKLTDREEPFRVIVSLMKDEN